LTSAHIPLYVINFIYETAIRFLDLLCGIFSINVMKTLE
jgi:hypothetical protein